MSRRFGRKRRRKLRLAMQDGLAKIEEDQRRTESFRRRIGQESKAWVEAMGNLKKELPHWVGLAPDVQYVSDMVDRYYRIAEHEPIDFNRMERMEEIQIAYRTLSILQTSSYRPDYQPFGIHLMLKSDNGTVSYALDAREIPDTAIPWLAEKIAKDLIKVHNEGQPYERRPPNSD